MEERGIIFIYDRERKSEREREKALEKKEIGER